MDAFEFCIGFQFGINYYFDKALLHTIDNLHFEFMPAGK